MKKLLIILLVVSVVSFLSAYQDGTGANTKLTNKVTVTAGNLAASVSNFAEEVTVRTQLGGHWAFVGGTYSEDATTGVGGTNFWITGLTNFCNVSADFIVRMAVVTNSNNSGGAIWTNVIGDGDTVSVDGNTVGQVCSNFTGTLAAGNATAITLKVRTAVDSSEGDFVTYEFFAYPTNFSASTPWTNAYTGDNSLVYGGQIGTVTPAELGAARAIPLTNLTGGGDNLHRLTVSGPVIVLEHTIESITNTTAGINLDDATPFLGLPGSTITYRVHATNAGTGNATALALVVNLDSEVSFSVADQLHVAAGRQDWAGSGADINDDGGTGAACTNVANKTVIFEPGGTAEDGATDDGAINAGASFSCLYKVTID